MRMMYLLTRPSSEIGARAFPSLLMVEPQMEGVEESRAAELFWGEEWSGQTGLTLGAHVADLSPSHPRRMYFTTSALLAAVF
jgi:hypothetical protein